ncbi:unnamed protein product [Lota lota]
MPALPPGPLTLVWGRLEASLEWGEAKCGCRKSVARLKQRRGRQQLQPLQPAERCEEEIGHYTLVVSLPIYLIASHSRGIPSGPTSRVSGVGTPGTLEGAGRPQEGAARQALQNQSRDSLISQATKGLRKFPIHRSRQEKQAIQKMLRSFSCLTNQMSAEELPCIADISIVEAWERGHAIFANYGFYVILKGSARPYDPDSMGTEKGPKGHVEELQAKSFTQKELLISSCDSYRRWPALSVHTLAHLLTVTHFPAKYVLVKEGEVPPFVGFIAEGECDVQRSTQGLILSPAPADRPDRTRPTSKGVRVQTLVVGKLGAATSFGMVSVLREQPSPCSVVTATEAQVGVIQADMMRGASSSLHNSSLDPGTISLILQSTKDAYGNLTQEELSQEYVRQKKAKQLESFKPARGDTFSRSQQHFAQRAQAGGLDED